MLGHKPLTKKTTRALRTRLRLFRLRLRAKVSGLARRGHLQTRRAAPGPVTHRYEEQIAGRTYQIEVRPVSDSRWRAQIVRLPGIPTAMMPFYGTTPEQAVSLLSQWLALVYNGTTQ